MLPRVLEPEVMDSSDEARDYDAMDHRAVNAVFVNDFLTVWDGHNLLLDVGTGTAQIPIALCQAAPTAQVVAIDLAEHMLQLGWENVCRAGLQLRVQLQKHDAKHLVFAPASFAGVISNSIIHHIPEPPAVFAEMVRVTAPGGILFVRDLLRPPDEASLRHLVTTYAGDANPHQQQMFAASLHAALTLDEVQDIVTALGFPADTVKQTSDRHWTWIGMKDEG